MKKDHARSSRKTVSHQENSPRPQEVNTVVALFTEGRYVEAAPLAQALTMRFPLHGFSWTVLGTILMQMGRLDEAEQAHRKAVLLDTESTVYRFNLANFLAASNRSVDVEEAKSIFLEIIKAEPTHFGAWNNLGRLLFETGYTSAAHTAFTAAVTYHPHEAAAHVNLGNVLLDKGDLSGAEEHFKIALEQNPGLSNAHQGLASILHRQGNEDKADYHRNMGFGKQPLSTLAYRGRGEAIQLLILASALEGNIPWRLLIDRDVFQTTIIAVEYFDSQSPLPSHQLIFNAIGDADLCRNGLEIANRLIEKSPAPVINRPAAVLQTGRLMNARQLAILPGVIAPRMALVSKTDIIFGQALKMLRHKEFSFPLLLRAPSFHGGNYFVCVDNQDALNSALEELPGENLLAIEFLDSGSKDNLFRKYRVMSINGALYPVHMAISNQWKVHYFSSDMNDNENYRHEEEVFLNDFSSFIGADAISALEKISQSLGLDYCGIDFGMDKHGNILLYEANSTMVIVPPTNEERWDYKREPIANALAATKRMFIERVINRN
jgi:Flp pilus assembly protein TadD/glutathione synthase/RimK-type ligase-like ATP-grasp enzyme